MAAGRDRGRPPLTIEGDPMTEEILPAANVRIAQRASSRDEAIRAAGAVLVETGAVEPGYVDSMLEREQSVSTYMGNFLAIPHGTNEAKDAIRRSALSVIRYDEPVDWNGEEARFVVGIAGIENEHLDILSKIAIIFSDEDEVQRLIDARDAAALHALLSEVNES
jgi:PTS system mannitol-specific IIA component